MQAKITAESLEGGALKLITTSPDIEFDLVRQAAGGSSNAFKQLYERNVSRVYAVCLRMAADTDLAVELTQEVFIKAWEKLGTFQFGSKFSSWLHSIAVNQFLMQKRSEKRFNEKVNEMGDMMTRNNPNQKARYHHDSRIDIENALAALPDQARITFVLHDIEGYKHHEISKIMNIEVGTSKAHLHRARKMLREELTK